MIQIADYKSLLNDLGTHCTLSFETIKTARTEDELSKIIKDISDYVLIGIVPSSDTLADGIDNIIENETIILYVLNKVSERDRTDESIEADIAIAQQYIFDIKKRLTQLYDDYNSPVNKLVRKIDFSSMHTDPEYAYMGCDGYSLSFILTTDWF